MTSMLSFSWRKAQESNHRPQRRFNPGRQHTDPWQLGVSTSTSSAESLAPQSSNDETMVSISSKERTPRTPAGLRPRKSILSLRSQLHATGLMGRSPRRELDALATSQAEPNARLQSSAPMSCFASSFTCGPKDLPSMLQCTGSPPKISIGSLYSQLSEHAGGGGGDFLEDEDIDDTGSNYTYDYDISSLQKSPSQRRSRSRHVAVSPDLQRGKAKTAVGALLVAMSEREVLGSLKGNKTDAFDQHVPDVLPTHEQSQHSILPPRAWMDDDEDDTIRDDTIDDDNESSLHMSPSSNPWRRSSTTSWKERQEQFQQDTSFTKGFLSEDPDCSWMHNHQEGQPPYNFDSIVPEGTVPDLTRGNSNQRPPVLAFAQTEDNELNVSAISHSYHPRDLEGQHSLADTIEDEDEEDFIEDSNEIPNYYQALTDEVLVKDGEMDNALLLAKVQNQRRIKEDLLLSTCERLQDELDLVMDLMGEINRGNDHTNQNFLLLGLAQEQRQALYHNLELLLFRHNTSNFNLEREDTTEAPRQSIIFCLSLLQLATSRDGTTSQLPTTKRGTSSSTMVIQRWKSIAGFRDSLGLEEEPQSPPTVRGGDTSLFSLPSDSVNENTPHTSNVSMTTTITTVISPDKNARQQHRQNPPWATFDSSPLSENEVGQRKTLEALASLLGRLEAAGMRLLNGTKSLNRSGGDAEVVDEIKRIYLMMLNLSMADLKRIVSSFDLIQEEPPYSYMTRTVSEDLDIDNLASTAEERGSFHSFGSKEPYDMAADSKNNAESLVSQTRNLSDDLARIDVIDREEERQDTFDSTRLSPASIDLNGRNAASSTTRERSDKDENKQDQADQPFDDLRRGVGSFDLASVQEERDAASSMDEDERDDVETPVNETIRTRFGRRTLENAFRNRKGRFWKRRFLSPKQGRHASAE